MRTAKDAAIYLKTLPEDLPVFVLIGTDPLAPNAIRTWANDAENADCVSAKVRTARQAAKAFEKWPEKRLPG